MLGRMMDPTAHLHVIQPAVAIFIGLRQDLIHRELGSILPEGGGLPNGKSHLDGLDQTSLDAGLDAMTYGKASRGLGHTDKNQFAFAGKHQIALVLPTLQNGQGLAISRNRRDWPNGQRTVGSLAVGLGVGETRPKKEKESDTGNNFHLKRIILGASVKNSQLVTSAPSNGFPRKLDRQKKS